MQLEAQKSELSRRYMLAVEHLKSMQKMLSQTEPELLATLRRHHETFRAMLQVNLTVLATAHAVSEGIVRGVNAEVQRRNIPNTYTATGQRATPGPRNMTADRRQPHALRRTRAFVYNLASIRRELGSTAFSVFPNSLLRGSP